MNSEKTANSETNVKTGFKHVNGINMYYEIHGTGKPVVLIHGGGSNMYTSFGRIMPTLSATQQVIAVDLQAHGRSSDRNAPESFEQDADDVADLLKQLNIAKANLIGFSNGGSTSLQVAIRHPQLVNKIVAISAMYKRSGMHAWFWDFMPKGTLNDMPQVYKDTFLKINPDKTKLQNMFNKDQQRMLAFKDWPNEALEIIKAPVLVMVGDKDVVRVEHALEMVQVLPNARLAVMPGGHGDFFGEIMSPKPDSKVIGLSVQLMQEFLDE